jgi:hypothetical protein
LHTQLVLVKVLVLRKLVQKLAAVAQNHGVKKVLAVHVLVLLVVQSGVQVA